MTLNKPLYRLLLPVALLLAMSAITITTARANDSAYYMDGNQLIPLQENDISIRKEVLTITEQAKTDAPKFTAESPRFAVDVDYTFYNPGEEKTVLMGFEAGIPYNGFKDIAKEHPYMKDFSVSLNAEKIPYQVKFVGEPLAVDSNMTDVSIKKVTAVWNTDAAFDSGYRYAYYFKATFKHGENKLRHRYQFSSKDSVSSLTELGYLLTPANRWANKQIDDFTLHINLLSGEHVYIERTFFDSAKHWSANGQAKPYIFYDELKMMRFDVAGNRLIFQQKNFHPAGELSLMIPREENFGFTPDKGYCFASLSTASAKSDYDFKRIKKYCAKANAFELKVLRNLPFAKRGYVFKDKKVQRYYEENASWYKADSSYRPAMSQLSDKEKEWVSYWKSQ